MSTKLLGIVCLALYPIMFILLMLLELAWLVQFKPQEMNDAMWETWKETFWS